MGGGAAEPISKQKLFSSTERREEKKYENKGLGYSDLSGWTTKSTYFFGGDFFVCFFSNGQTIFLSQNYFYRKFDIC